MKKLLFTLFASSFVALTSMAQEANRIIGTYATEGERAKVAISKQGDKFIGTLIWTMTEGKKDSKNPDASLRNKPLVGKVILKDFVYSGKDVWEKGTIYDPESGKTYSCKITRQANGDLKVRGFIGVSLLGRNSMWTRLKEK